MSRITAFALVVAALGASARAGRSAMHVAERLTGSISGTVTVNGKPASGVRVMATLVERRDDRPAAVAISDARGTYTLSGVAPGAYVVQAHAPALVLERRIHSSSEPGIPVTVGDRLVEGVDVVLTSGGVITGRVTSAGGEPIVRESVSLLRVLPNGDRERVDGLGWPPKPTDDRGIYRLYGLEPGRYLVAVGRASTDTGPWASRYTRSYFPSVTDIARAESVDVTAGSETKNVDLVVADRATVFTATGRVRYADSGGPVAGVSVSIGPVVDGRLRSYSGAGIATDAAGAFRLTNLSAGTYRAFFRVDENPTHYAEPLTFEVRDADVTGLEVRFEKGRAIAGRVAFDDDDTAAAAKRRTLRIAAYASTRSADWSPSPPAVETVGTDGTFRIDALKPGAYRVDVGWSGNGSIGRFYAWSTEVAGAVTTEPIAVTAGEDVDGVVVHIRYGEDRVAGLVTVSGEIPAGAQLFAALRRDDGATVAYSSPLDERHRFVLENVPTGEYVVLITGYVPGTEMRYESKPARVTVRPGAAQEVDIAFDPSRDVVEREKQP